MFIYKDTYHVMVPDHFLKTTGLRWVESETFWSCAVEDTELRVSLFYEQSQWFLRSGIPRTRTTSNTLEVEVKEDEDLSAPVQSLFLRVLNDAIY